jgi:DNA-directed RNA polymerase specialized sigma24 family protein
VIETVFERSYSVTSRLAAVQAANIVARYRLPLDLRRDLVQDALLCLWQKQSAYDAQRGSWRAFSEKVVANRMASLVRRMCSQRFGQLREDPFESVAGSAAPNHHLDLRTDVVRVLAAMSPFDRSVASNLIYHSAIETGQRLGISRATVYRAIGRLRVAFTTAGLARGRHGRQQERHR